MAERPVTTHAHVRGCVRRQSRLFARHDRSAGFWSVGAVISVPTRTALALASAALMSTGLALGRQSVLSKIDGRQLTRIDRIESTPDVDSDGRRDFLISGIGPGVLRGLTFLRSSSSGETLWLTQIGLINSSPWDCGPSESLVLGDFDGDGDFDVVVGCPRVAPPGPGEVFILDGPTGEEILRIPVTQDDVGRFLGAVGDTNGDGFADLVIGGGAFQQSVHLGPDGRLAYTVPGPSDVHGAAAVGDLDFDGNEDIVLTWVTAGLVTVHSGIDGFELGRFCIASNCPGGYGLFPVKLGDVNGDGVPDFALSNPNLGFTANGDGVGVIRVISGADFSTIHEIQGRGHFPPGSSIPGSNLGASLSGGWDINGDGVNDLVASTSSWPQIPFQSAVAISGRTGQILYRARLIEHGGVLDIGGLVTFASALHDVDGDGYADWGVGNALADFNPPNSGNVNSGRIIILSGGPGDVEEVCDALPHSVGQAARIHFYDAITEFSRGFEIRVDDAVPSSTAFVYYGLRAPATPLGDGRLCLDRQSAVFYGPPLQVDAAGRAIRAVGWGDPVIGNAWLAGTSWTVQAVFTDPGSPNGLNTTNAVEVTFNR
ncbi:MAG: FG-GAP-like repeat-containing protein [Planctomycetota bacterium]